MAYLALSTANLPNPAIDPAQGASPEDHFNTVLYTGTQATKSVTGVGFEPSLVWLKNRSSAVNHYLVDQVRGATKALFSNSTAAEDTDPLSLQSFDSDGFTLGSSYGFNASGDAYVAWNWKANGSGVSNNAGSIPSTVSANTTSGFSICTFTPSGSNFTFGHGLNVAPDAVWVKNRDDGAANWVCYQRAIGATQYLMLNSANGAATSSLAWQNTDPTSSVVYVGAFNYASGQDYVAYCFHSVDGFSKFGSYVGNGSTDGPFVYTGFRPAFVLGKNITNAGNHWFMVDQERTTFNGGANWIKADASSAELTNLTNPDFLSNGFKIRSSDAIYNTSGSTFIYMAFAENPFKYSNAR